MIVSTPLCISSEVMSTLMSGDTPNSMWFMSGSNMGLAEKRTDHPLGNSEEKGSPEPPPVLSPMTMTLGSCFILFTKSLVELYDCRLVSTATGFFFFFLLLDGSR